MKVYDNYQIIFTAQQKAGLLHESLSVSPAPGEIIGKTLVSVISSGSERGGYMNYYGGGTYPCKTGYAVVMEVVEVGKEVRNIKAGDIVFSQAPHQLINQVKEENAIVVPAGMNTEHAVLARFPAVSMTTMIHTCIKPTEPVIVTGLGIVGLTCAQMMQNCGYKVYAADPVDERRETAQHCGLRYTLSSLDSAPFLKESCGLAIECSGDERATYSLPAYLRKGGELSLVGVPWRRTTDTFAHELLRMIFSGYLKVYSGWEWSLPLHSCAFLPNSSYRSFQKAMEWIQEGAIKVDGIYKTFDPTDCDSVYQAISNNNLNTTCAIFDWRNYKLSDI